MPDDPVLQRADVNPDLEKVIQAVCANSRYRLIDPSLVKRVSIYELSKGRKTKETVKAVRSKLHQVGGAYLESPIDFTRLEAELLTLPTDLTSPELRTFCRKAMSLHASTRERLPDLETFYLEILHSIAPVNSILDLACGLNPLTIPWQPLTPGGSYYACDIFQDFIDFTNRYLKYLAIPGEAFLCDLTQSTPDRPVQLTLLLKTLPCLEQLDKGVAPRLLASIQSEYLLVSFPARSLGGKSKGMVKNYEDRFLAILSGGKWEIKQRYLLSNELAFLLSNLNR